MIISFRKFTIGIAESILTLVFTLSSAALKKISKHRWEIVTKNMKDLRGLGAGGAPDFEWQPNKQKRPEMLVQSGSLGESVFISQEKRSIIEWPKWAQEIPPFLANQLSDHTRRAYEKDLKQFIAFISDKNLLGHFTELSPQHIILFRKALEEGRVTGAPLAKSSVNRKLATVKSFLNWLKLNRVVNENPALLVKGYPQTQESGLLGLSDEEAKKMLEATRLNTKSGVMHCAVLHMLLYLGLRKSELINLSIGDWGEERGVSVLKVRGKGHRVRVLPLTERLKLVLGTYMTVNGRDKTKTEEPLFTPTKNPRMTGLIKRMHPQAITYIVTRYARRAGVMKKISPHSCRATCISHALDRKASQRSVQHLAGWSTPLMIQRYDKRREDLKNSAAFVIDYFETQSMPTTVPV